MASATAPINTPERAGQTINLPVAAATILYAGTMVARDASGNAVSATDAANRRVVGRAEETIDNSAGSAGDLSINVKRGVFRFANSAGDAVDADDEGKLCYVEDNQTVCEAGATNPIVAGRVIDVDSDGVWVEVGFQPVKTGVTLTQDTLTDNTTGAVTTTLKAIRSDTGAHTAADAADNFAVLAAENAKIKTDIAALKAALLG